MTTLIFKNTSKKEIINYSGIGVLQDYVKNSAINDYADYIMIDYSIDNTFITDYANFLDKAKNSHRWLQSRLE